jgi:hypothetical protein
MDHEVLRRENEALKRALEEAKQRELEGMHQQLEASQDRERRLQRDLEGSSARERQILRMLEHLTMGRPLPLPGYPTPPAAIPFNDTAPLSEQVLHYFETHPGPHSVRAAQIALGTTRSVKDALAVLHKRGEVLRVARGIYQAAMPLLPETQSPVPAAQPAEKPNEPQPDSLIGRVLTYVRDAKDNRVRPWQVQNALGLKRAPGRELAKLAQRGMIDRVGQSTYAAKPVHSLPISDEKQEG